MRDSNSPIEKILFIEDSDLYGEVITQLHSTVHKRFYGECSLYVRTSWPEGVADLEEQKPSVILLDLTLPPMGPDDTLAELALVWKKLPPVMVLTGGDPCMRRTAILAGADDFMGKMEANRNPELLCERLYNCFLRRLRDART